MSTNKADAYSPEAIAQREQEGITLCENCMTEHYQYENHRPGLDCPPELEYATAYNAAPDFEWGVWDAAWPVELDEIEEALADHPDGPVTELARRGWELDKGCLSWAREKLGQGFAIYYAQDEDGYYFAKASDGGEGEGHADAHADC